MSWLATMELATSESIKPQAEPMAAMIVSGITLSSVRKRTRRGHHVCNLKITINMVRPRCEEKEAAYSLGCEVGENGLRHPEFDDISVKQ